MTRSLPYLMGEFRWTGFDYIGESGGWPQVLGNFRIIGSGNGDPLSHTSYQANTLRTFNGLARVILAATSGPDDSIARGSDRQPGEIVIKASSRGLPGAEIRLTRSWTGDSGAAIETPSPPDGSATDEVDGLPAADPCPVERPRRCLWP